MNLARKIHDLFRVKGDQKGAIASAISQAGAATITQVVIAGAGGSTGNNNGGLNDEERLKFDSIEYGAQKNQDAFSNLDLNAVNFDVDGQLVSTSSVSISANTPTDKANVKIIGLDPLVVTLESEPLFNSTQVECTGLYNSIYKIEYIDNNSKVKLTYISGDQFLSADIDVIKVTHGDTVLAEYPIGEYSYTVAGEAITSFTIPYSTPNFALIRFYKYQQEDTELENGSIVTNEVLQLLATIEASPTTQSVIKLSNPYQELWHYLEDEDGNQFLWTDCNVFSTKEVSAYGKRTGSGTSEGAGYLYELGDVSADAKDPANNSILLYNSTTKKWEVTDGSNIKTDLSSYATIAYTKQYVGDLIKILKGDAPATLDTLEELAAAIGNDPNFGTTVTTNIDTLTDKVSDLNTKVELFLSWFVWDDANGAIKALHNLYGVSEIAAYGYGKEEEITIRTQLGDLSDVSIRDVQDGNILMYNSESGKWINVSKTSVGLNETELANYLVTNGYKNSANSLTIEVNYVPVGTYNPFSEVKSININVPTKVSDLDNDTLVSNTRKVTAGTGLAGGGTLNDDIELRLATFGTAGDYYKVTVDEYGRVSTGNTTLDIADITNLLSSLDSKLDISEIEKWFTIIYDTNGDITSIQANYTFYSVGEISAYGLGDIGSATRTTLASMDDVDISDSLAKDDILVYNGTKWVNTQMSQIQGVSTWDDLLGKPTTISGFGIADAYTKTEVDNKVNTINSSIVSINSSISTITTDISTISTSLSNISTKLDTFLEGSDTDDIINKWKELEAFLAGYTQTQTLAELLEVKANSSVNISAGTGLTGGGDLTTDRTISLATSGVTAGTYTKVTVDAYGRVTSGDTLLDTDIPDLDWSKITTGKPTTLAGYGITDGVNSITVTGDGNAITTVSISNHLLTFTKGETFLPKSTFDDLFEKVNVGTSDNPVYAIKAKYNLYSVGEVAAYGFGDTGTVKGTLASLEDVNINTPAKGQALVYDGTNWTNLNIAGISVEGYVDTTTDLTIEGIKTFTDTIKYEPTYYSYNAEDIEYRNTTGTLFGGIGAVHNGSSISYFYIGKGSTPWDSNNGLTIGDELGFKGYTVWHSGNAVIPTVPTKLSAFKDDVVAGKYLPLSGGTLTGVLNVGNSSLSTEGIQFYRTSTTWDSLWANTGILYFSPNTTIGVANSINYTILHSGNYNQYALPLTGGTMQGSIKFNSSSLPEKTIQYVCGIDAFDKGGEMGWMRGASFVEQYAPTKTGTGASGTWSINTTGYSKALASIYGTITSGDMSNRPKSANITYLDKCVRYFLATSSMTTGKPSWDAHVLHLAWDNVSFGAQLALPTHYPSDSSTSIQWRMQKQDTSWDSWRTVVDNTTIGSYNAGSATKLQTARTIFGKSFNGTANVTGGAKFYTICIETNDSLDDTGRGAEINCYDDHLYLQHNSTKYTLMCTGGGNVGIGTVSPVAKLHVVGGQIRCEYPIFGYRYNTNTNSAAFIWDKPGSNYTGVGSDGTTDTIRFSACNASGDWVSYTQNWKFYGNIIATGEITAYSSSDIRLKTNLNKLNSLSIIRKLGVYSFDWNEEALQLRVNKNIHDYGLIAQLVQLYIPEVINTNMFNKGYLGIDYLRLVPFTISAIKEVDDEVTKLKKRVKQLERRLLKYESTEVFYTKGND